MEKNPTCHPETPYFAKDLCNVCYMRRYRETHPLAPKTKPCEIEGCTNLSRSRMCGMHYDRIRKHGDPHYIRPGGKDPQHNYQKRSEHRRSVYDILKTTAGCHDCGESFVDFPSVLEFDHVSGDKLDNVASLQLLSYKRIFEEIAKCEVVCANCHRIRTAKRRLLDS